MSTIDYRLAARRAAVRETRARIHLRWLVGLITTLLVAGATLLALRSPLLAVTTVEVNGVAHAGVAAILAAHGVEPGAPTVAVDAGSVEAALARDPWVARADVRVVWPGTIEVTVLEHESAGWIEAARGWRRVSGTGDVLERSNPPPHAPIVITSYEAGRPGTVVDDSATIAALEFLAYLPPARSRDAEVVVRRDGTLKAIVAGHKVRLGLPSDMAAKAASLLAVLGSRLEDDAVISVIAPSRPAVTGAVGERPRRGGSESGGENGEARPKPSTGG